MEVRTEGVLREEEAMRKLRDRKLREEAMKAAQATEKAQEVIRSFRILEARNLEEQAREEESTEADSNVGMIKGKWKKGKGKSKGKKGKGKGKKSKN
eukprot:704694-Karenia_brevis.AAC.1